MNAPLRFQAIPHLSRAASPSPSLWRRHGSDTRPAYRRWALEWLPAAHPAAHQAATWPYDDLHLQIASQDIVNLRGLSAPQRLDIVAMLTGRTRPAGGTTRIAGLDPWQLSASGRRGHLLQEVGCASADAMLSPGISVRDNIALALLRIPVQPPTAFDFVEAELSLLGLTPCADRLPRQLSPSEYGLAALACAAVHCPRLLIYEPPQAGLTAVEVASVRRRLWLAADRQGCAVLMSTEQPELASLATTSLWPRRPWPSPARVPLRDPA